ncbi:MAG: hypothetical protein GXP16_18480 [Gammaproteobacteria bacterium]|nr:hypothetical protein [Gammaproteobacteria bacterium]
MKSHIALCIYGISLVLNPGIVCAKDSSLVTLQYAITSEAEFIGSMTVKIIEHDKVRVIAEHSRLSFEDFWETTSLHSNLIEHYHEGDLVSADNKVFESANGYWTNVDSNDDEIWGSFTEVNNVSQRDREQFDELTRTILRLALPNSNELLPLSQRIFNNITDKPRSVRFSRTDFDTTFNGLPFFIRDQLAGSFPKMLNILDTEELSVSRVKLIDLGSDIVPIGGQEIAARHFQIDESKSTPAYIWVVVDQVSTPHMVQFTGTDEDGSFKIKLKAVYW